MSDPLTLVVPVDARYRVLAPEIAAKFAEISGGSSADGEALAGTLSGALAKIADGAADGDHVNLTLQVRPAGVEITLQCRDRSTVVTQPLPARRS